MLGLDTNILVRLVTNDDPVAAERIQVALDAELTAGRECMVSQIVLCELVWVLQRLYGYSLHQCQATVSSLLGFGGLRFEALPVVLCAYKAWEKHGGDSHRLAAGLACLTRAQAPKLGLSVYFCFH